MQLCSIIIRTKNLIVAITTPNKSIAKSRAERWSNWLHIANSVSLG